MTSFAVIKTGGKQYFVRPGQRLKVEKLEKPDGSVADFEVLLIGDEKGVDVGTPHVKGIKVSGKVIAQGRDKKKIIFRYHAKTRYRKMKGHRQPYTEIQILDFKRQQVT